MRRTLLIAIILFTLVLPPSTAFAQGMPALSGVEGMSAGIMPIMGNWGQNPFVWFGFGSWLITLTLVVWLIVGVLATIWLWKQLKKK